MSVNCVHSQQHTHALQSEDEEPQHRSRSVGTRQCDRVGEETDTKNLTGGIVKGLYNY